MAHVFTLDLNTVPELKKNFPEDVVAFSLFLSSFMFNEAYAPMNKETATLLLTKKDLESGENNWIAPSEDDFDIPESSSFICHEVKLPSEVFDHDIYEREETDPVYILGDNLCQFTIVGGEPIWLQGAEYSENIVIQFDEDFIDINLGDGGVMYVFKDTAFWQCH